MSNTTKSPGNMFTALKALYAGLQSAELPTNCTQITANGTVTSIADLTTEVAAMVKLTKTK